MNKILGLIFIMGTILFNPHVAKATNDLPLKNVSGIAFQDLNNNTVYEPLKFEPVLKGIQVSLYRSLEDSKNEINSIDTTQTNGLGGYMFSNLKNGKYYMRYSSQITDYRPSRAENAMSNENGIVHLDISDKQIFYKENLSFDRLTDISVVPFSDNNQNGIQEQDENLLNGKTMIILNTKKLSIAVKNGTLNNLNISDIIFNSLKDGNVDLADGIYLRTTNNNQPIKIPSLEAGVYVAIRSPFNLTIKDSLANMERLKAILEIMSGGDINAVLNNVSLLSTGDITTNNDNAYIHSLFTIFPKLYDELNKIDFSGVLGEEHSKKITESLANLNNLNNLLAENIPAFRVAVVDYYGNVYDFTGLNVSCTNTLLFGIKEYASLEGLVYSDYDGNGVKGKLELTGVEGKVVVYDEYGNIVGEDNTTTTKQSFSINKVPYDTKLFVSLETEKPVYPLMDSQDIPEGLKNKKIVGNYFIPSTSVETKINQNIGVLPTNPTTVSATMKSVNYLKGDALVSFINKDKLNSVDVTYKNNGQIINTVTLVKAPLFGNPKAVEQSFSIYNSENKNKLIISWNKGPYVIYLDPLIF